MPVAQQDYAVFKAFLNGAPILNVESIDIETESGVQPVHLLGEGLGGFTSGSGMVTLVIGIKIPIGGQEHPFQQMAANEEYVEMQVFVGRESYNGRGKFTNVKLTSSADSAAQGTVTFLGPKKPLS